MKLEEIKPLDEGVIGDTARKVGRGIRRGVEATKDVVGGKRGSTRRMLAHKAKQATINKIKDRTVGRFSSEPTIDQMKQDPNL